MSTAPASDDAVSFVSCPNCSRPVSVPAVLTTEMSYPDDVEVIADVLFGRFNAEIHSCGKSIAFLVPLTVRRPSTREIVLIGCGAGPAQADGWSVSAVDDYNDLRHRLGQWLETDTAPLWRRLNAGKAPALSWQEAMAGLTPLHLLKLALLRTPAALYGRPVDPAVRSTGVAFTVGQLREAVRRAIGQGHGGELESAVAARIPSDALDAPVLASLDAAAAAVSEVDLDALPEAHLALVACAVAHAVTQTPNPTQSSLAALMADLQRLEHQSGTDLGIIWLTPAQWRRLLDAETVMRNARDLAAEEEQDQAIEVVYRFLRRLGWAELVGTFQFRPRDGQRLLGVDELAELLVSTVPSVQQIEADDWQRGAWLAEGVFTVRQLHAPGAETHLVAELISRLTRTATPTGLLGFLTALIRKANSAYEFDLADRAADDADRVIRSGGTTPDQCFEALLEIGNSLRNNQRWTEATERFKAATQILPRLTGDRAMHKRQLDLNRALLLIGTGRYTTAEDLLIGVLDESPGDVKAVQTLAFLYERTGRLQDARSLADDQLARPGLGPDDTVLLTLLRALVEARLGDHDGATADCRAAMHIAGSAPMQRLQIATCALLIEPTDTRSAEFVAGCLREVMESLGRASADSPMIALSAGTIAVLHMIRNGDHEQAERSLIKVDAIVGTLSGSAPWQLRLAHGRLAYERGDLAASFDHLTTAITDLDTQAHTSDFVMGMLADVAVEDLQRLAGRVGVPAVVTGHRPPSELLAVFDFANGRDLTARAGQNAGLTAGGRPTITALDRWQAARQVDVVTLLDDTETLHLLVQPANQDRYLVDTGIAVRDLTAAVRTLATFDRVNPLRPERIDPRHTSWWELAGIVAAYIRRELPSDGELVLVPGRVLVGTPLSAAGWPGRPLIADRPVTVSPNHRLLAGRPRRRPFGTACGLIAVPKAADRAAFTDELRGFEDHFRQRVPDAVILSGPEADEAKCLRLLGEAGAVFAVSHGVHGGPDFGPGLCVAAGGLLPGSPLDVVTEPDLGAFVLTWDDVAELPRSPDLLASVACSSGRTVVGTGGSRLGLEQGTLANSTRFLIAPLWPVHQLSSLDWVRSFLDHLVPAADGILAAPDVPRWHQAATLAVRELYPHPYHWAPFQLGTALRGGPE